MGPTRGYDAMRASADLESADACVLCGYQLTLKSHDNFEHAQIHFTWESWFILISRDSRGGGEVGEKMAEMTCNNEHAQNYFPRGNHIPY